MRRQAFVPAAVGAILAPIFAKPEKAAIVVGLRNAGWRLASITI